MTPRERVISALDHRESDRTPADLGSTCNTSITRIAYTRLVEHLGMERHEPEILSRDMQVVAPDEALLRRLRIDTRGVHGGAPDAGGARDLGGGEYLDEWGMRYRAARRNGSVLYYEVVHSPLAEAETVRDIESHGWPDPLDPGRTRGLAGRARNLRERTDCAVVGHMGDTGIFQACAMIRGMEPFLMDLLVNKPLASALLERVTHIQSVKMESFLRETGAFLDVVGVGDDFAGQNGPLLSPGLFREMVKPWLRGYYELIRRRTGARLHLHSCGAVRDLLGDLIELGVQVLNPVQVSARGMDPAELKREFGRHLSFWGGIDTQRLLPTGTPSRVCEEVRRIVGILGAGGGYVLNPVHNIQPDVPPENVVALYEAVR